MIAVEPDTKVRLWIYGALAAALLGIFLYEMPQDQRPEPQTTYGRQQFEQMVSGKTKLEVVALLGDPGVVQPVTPVTEYYDYSDLKYRAPVRFMVRDDTTGAQLKNVTVWFDATGHEDHVGY